MIVPGDQPMRRSAFSAWGTTETLWRYSEREAFPTTFSTSL